MIINNNLKKILCNFLFAFVASIILVFIIPAPDLKGLWTISILTTFFFTIATFYGDDDFNITKSWPPKVKKVKNIIGNIFATILLIAGFMLCVILLLILGNH